MSAPVYCSVFFSFARNVGYEKEYYPVIKALSTEQWHRALFFYGIMLVIEALIFALVSLYHTVQDNMEFAPYTQGYKQLRTISTTIITIPMCAYMMLTLALWQHQFEPIKLPGDD